jgi:hypothetical protein
MDIRKNTLRDILDPNSKIESEISRLFIAILGGGAVSTISKLSRYGSKRSFDQALYKQGCLSLFSSNIIEPLRDNETAQTLLSYAHVDIQEDTWKTMGSLPLIVEALGFRIYGSEVSKNVYGIAQIFDSYSYKDIIEFVEISSSSVLKRIQHVETPENLSASSRKDEEEVGYWKEELNKAVNKLEAIAQSEKYEKQGIIKILKRLIEISCKKKMVYYLPNIVPQMATCYYYLGAYVDCIAMFDFAFSAAKYTNNPSRRKHFTTTWIASSVRRILCSNPEYFVENPDDFEEMYNLVKSFNRKAFYDYQYSTEIAIQSLWNLCYLELSLIVSYRKTKLEDYNKRIDAACDRLDELIHVIKRKSVDFSGTIKSQVLQDLDVVSKDLLSLTNDFVDLSHQLRNL